MPCEYLVKSRANGKGPRHVPCGREAKYYAIDGGLTTIEMWLCAVHAGLCTTMFKWTLRELPPPEVEPEPPNKTDIEQ